jgi:erythromycin esterase
MRTFCRSPILPTLVLAMGLLAGCDSPMEGGPGPLLTDEQLHVPLEPGGPQVNAAWADWLRRNHHPVRSLTAEDFSDLQFLKPLIGNRRLVQLGESTHGAREFNQAKVRLVKFLHQEMGFDVIAFESGMYECYAADRRSADATPRATMQECIFGVWHTREVLALFEYMAGSTRRPLTLAGIDIQRTGPLASRRPELMHAALLPVDSALARRMGRADTAVLHFAITSSAQQDPEQARSFSALYDSIAGVLQRNAAVISAAYPRQPEIGAVAARAARNQHLLLERGLTGNHALRDEGMAENVSFLLQTLYPGRKIIVWAHNFHIRHDRPEFMGYHLVRRHRPELYTVGFHMAAGESRSNQRQPIPVVRPPDNGLEALMLHTERRMAFVDFLHQPRTEGSAWLYQTIPALTWGLQPYPMVPRNHYDALFYVHTTSMPDDLLWWSPDRGRLADPLPAR